jgi:hypothetical protein
VDPGPVAGRGAHFHWHAFRDKTDDWSPPQSQYPRSASGLTSTTAVDDAMVRTRVSTLVVVLAAPRPPWSLTADMQPSLGYERQDPGSPRRTQFHTR